MRLLIIVLTLILFVAILGFVLSNLDTRLDLHVLGTVHPAVALYLVVIVAVLVGIVYAGIIAVAEGAHIRLVNRRLSRQIQKLETEIHYLRTQPPVGRSEEPDSLPDAEPAEPAEPQATAESRPPKHRPSAPVYHTDPGTPVDDDDDFYSGGSAV